MKNGLVIDKEGSHRWYQNGQLHREDSPAVEYVDGDRCWYQNDQLHRTDGPAVEWANGNHHWWYLNGIQHAFEEYVNKIYPNDSPKKTLFILKWSSQ